MRNCGTARPSPRPFTRPLPRAGAWQRAAQGCAVAAGLAFGAAMPAAAAETYLVTGLPYFDPYRAAVATIDVQGGKVQGSLAAPAGDPRATIPLSGTLQNGILKLTVGSGADAPELTFAEEERGIHHVWWETATVPGLTEVVVFRPTAGFSGAALALQHSDAESCGLVYGGLSVKLKAADVLAAATAPAALADLEVPLALHNGGTAKAKVKDIWGRLRLAARDEDDIAFDVTVPLGAEAKTAQELRKVPGVLAVTLPLGCGEMALATVPSAALGDNGAVSEAKLKSYLDGLIARLVSGAAPENRTPGARKFKITGAGVTSEGGVPVFTATITAESEATRLAKGSFDQYTLTVRPMVTAADTADTISLIPSVTAVKTARKASGGQIPPDSAFTAQSDTSVPAAIAHRFVSWVSSAEGSRCSFLTRTAFDEPEDAITCGNVVLDGFTEDGDN